MRPSNGRTPALTPIELVSRLIVTMKQAPRQRVVDVAFDIVCRRAGYIPRRVLAWMVAEGYVFLDDSHPGGKVIGLTRRAKMMGAKPVA